MSNNLNWSTDAAPEKLSRQTVADGKYIEEKVLKPIKGREEELKTWISDISGKIDEGVVSDSYLSRAQWSANANSGLSNLDTNSAYNFIVGSGNIVEKGFAYGINNTASNMAFAAGEGIVATASYETAVGQYNNSATTDMIFEVGNGTSNDARSNAFEIHKNGDVKVKHKDTMNSLSSLLENAFEVSANNDEHIICFSKIFNFN